MTTDPQIIAALSIQETLGLTAWAEARGDRVEGGSSLEERVAVMCVIRNRSKLPRWKGKTLKDICLAPRQFSCWAPLEGEANHAALMRVADQVVHKTPLEPDLVETLWLADGVLAGIVLDRVRGATLYYAPAAMRPPGSSPVWARTRAIAAKVGSQLFFVE